MLILKLAVAVAMVIAAASAVAFDRPDKRYYILAVIAFGLGLYELPALLYSDSPEPEMVMRVLTFTGFTSSGALLFRAARRPKQEVTL